MKYICNECGAVFDKIPRVYRGFSGDHFGGSETMLPGCTHCGKYDFSQYTDDGHREILALREQIKVLREALDGSVGVLENCAVSTGYCCCGRSMTPHSFFVNGHAARDFGEYSAELAVKTSKAALEQTKPKEGE